MMPINAALSMLRNRTSRPTGTIMAPPKPCSTRAAVSSTDIVGKAAEDRAEREQRDRGAEHGAAAEPIRRPAADRNEHREAEQIGRDRNTQPHRIGVQRDRHLRQRRGDHGGIDLLHDDRRADDHGDGFGFPLGRTCGRRRNSRGCGGLDHSIRRVPNRA